VREINRHIAELITQSHGIDISKYDESFLDKSFQRRMDQTQSNDAGDYFNLLENSQNERNSFTDSLQVSYSEFFRNQLTFAVLEQIILPSIVLKKKKAIRKEIRIWSAACAGGQEVYSLAILLEELKIGEEEKIKMHIFATDQSEDRIKEAELGLYPANALNQMSLKRAQLWFTNKGGNWAVIPELKENIDFSVFDLLERQPASPPASIFGDFDLIVCANLLFYYKPEIRKRILDKISSSLAFGGYLVTGEAEREILMNNGYHEVFPQSAIFQK
jgi:chemotaxis protein methyltransferase CheR